MNPPSASSIEFWVDASSSWGVGVVFDKYWDHWQLHCGWDKGGRNIGWAEMVAIELGLLFAIHLGHSDVHFIFKSDNQGVIHAIEGGRSRSQEHNMVLQQITSLLSSYKIWISSHYVPSLDNLADPPSQGSPPIPRYSRLPSTFIIPSILQAYLVYPDV